MPMPHDFETCDRCVLQPWLDDLTYKQQTVLLSAIRGPEGVPKEDVSKKLLRKFRSEILRNAAAGNDEDVERHFMKEDLTIVDIEKFLGGMDHYYMHWLMHFIHAVEIIGFNHPDLVTANWWLKLYYSMVQALHLNPESQIENEMRLADGFPRDCWK